tara:strand:+ start:426 stop:956 length:531 start_codon:yes stop_codon:yes gene_type:complete
MRVDRGVHPLAETKVKDFLEPYVQGFIENSPFVVVASSNAQGDCDASPKGGKPGFVKIVDDRTLMMPDIGGNNLFQSFENYESNPKLGLIFMIPGMDTTVRVNGRVTVVEKEQFVERVKEPELYWSDKNAGFVQATLIEVDEAYFHCPRSFKFAGLWDTEIIRANSSRNIASLKSE